MTFWLFALLVWLGSLAAGFLGALTGLGGGVILIPLLTIAFHVDLRYAIGASLVSIIAVSSGSAASYLRGGLINLRVGMILETATALGAVAGAFLAPFIATRWLSVIFGGVLLGTVYVTTFRLKSDAPVPPAATLGVAPTDPLGLATGFRDRGHWVSYQPQRVGAGVGCMLGAGVLSGLLGIGAGAFKVLAMDRLMRLPFKASTTTSNFMMGVTAAASAGIYLGRGYIDPHLALPVFLGTLPGALVGSHVLTRARVGVVRLVFAALVALLAVRMIWEGIAGA